MPTPCCCAAARPPRGEWRHRRSASASPARRPAPKPDASRGGRPAGPPRPWYGRSPQMAHKIQTLIGAQRYSEARALLEAHWKSCKVDEELKPAFLAALTELLEALEKPGDSDDDDSDEDSEQWDSAESDDSGEDEDEDEDEDDDDDDDDANGDEDLERRTIDARGERRER